MKIQNRKGQGGPLAIWFALVGIIFLALAGPILSGVFDVVAPNYGSGIVFIIGLIIPFLAIGVIWGIISSRGG